MSASESFNSLPFFLKLNQSTEGNITEIIMEHNYQNISVQLNENYTEYEQQWNFLYFVRIMFYLLVFLKMLSLIFFKRKKLDIKDRIYRKFLFSHAQIIKQFNQDDRQLMQTVLNNTIKNANLQNLPKLRSKTSSKIKSVKFYQQKNEYYQPKNLDQINKFDSLQQTKIGIKQNFQEKNQISNHLKIISSDEQKKEFQIVENKQNFSNEQNIQLNYPDLTGQDDFVKNNLQKIQTIIITQSKWEKND